VQLSQAVSIFNLGAREFGNAEEAAAMVQAAIEFMQENGHDAIIEEVNQMNKGQFIDRDLYISIYGINGKIAGHGANRRLWGIDWSGIKDTDGKFFVSEIVNIAKSKGDGWIDYKWVHPVTKDTMVKSAYFEKCDDLVIACGFYKT
jgi:signal transduction histidine kinase